MSIANGYATLADAKAWLGISDTSDDPVIEDTIEAVSRQIDGHTGRRFWVDATNVTRLFTATQVDVLYTPDLATVASIMTDTGADRTFETTWATTDYDLFPEGGIVNGETGWPTTMVRARVDKTQRFPTISQGVQIVGKWGWLNIPDPVKQACLIAAARIFRRKDAPFGVAGVVDTGVFRVPRLDPDVQALLVPYVLLSRSIG